MDILSKIKQKPQKPLVFISGPYTSETYMGRSMNVYRAMHIANKVLELGGVPFIPHLTHYWDAHSPKDWSDWLMYDSYWLERCSHVVRMRGDSVGADAECALARSLGIPVIEEAKLDEFTFSWKE